MYWWLLPWPPFPQMWSSKNQCHHRSDPHFPCRHIEKMSSGCNASLACVCVCVCVYVCVCVCRCETGWTRQNYPWTPGPDCSLSVLQLLIWVTTRNITYLLLHFQAWMCLPPMCMQSPWDCACGQTSLSVILPRREKYQQSRFCHPWVRCCPSTHHDFPPTAGGPFELKFFQPTKCGDHL